MNENNFNYELSDNLKFDLRSPWFLGPDIIINVFQKMYDFMKNKISENIESSSL